MPAYSLLLAVLAGAVLVVLILVLVEYRRFRGRMLVTCPETREPVAVAPAAAKASLSFALGVPKVELKDCSRWPEREDCDQDCTPQIEMEPGEHQLATIFRRWYLGKRCALCGKEFGAQGWQHRPALLSPEGVTRELVDVPTSELVRALARDIPICWDCHIVQSIYRLHPELVVERPWKWGGDGGATEPPPTSKGGNPS